MNGNQRTGIVLAVCVAALFVPSQGQCTPSTQIWIPSTDIQKFAVVHFNFDTFFRVQNEPDGSRKAPVVMLGPTIGILPFEMIQAEIGFDLTFMGDNTLDRYPPSFHAKLAMPEDAMFTWSPAIAVGIYNIGIKKDMTNQNVVYGLIARTIPYLGRLSAGYYWGNKNVLVDQNGKSSNHGILASWDRTMSEISDRLWLAVDFQQGNSALGSMNFGVAWAFTQSTSLILGYDLYLNRKVAGKDTITVQADYNF